MGIKKGYFRALLATALTFIAASAYTQDSRPVVSDINAYPSASNKITVSWSLPSRTTGSTITSLQVYRDTKPVTDITGLEPVAILPYGSVTYTDTVYDYKEYYYAVISITRQGSYSQENELYYDEELDLPVATGEERPYILILPGVNSTVQGAKVMRRAQEIQVPQQETTSSSRDTDTVSDLREQPLPFIDILGEGSTEEHQITQETAALALALAGGKTSTKKTQVLEPYIFEEDYVSPSGGDEYLLFEVLRTTFIQKKYSQSITSLERFLALNRNQQVTARAKFYLGQSYYYTGQYQNAIKMFMATEEDFPSLSSRWIEASLDLYTAQ